MYSTFYLLQDVLCKKIIGCGTKRGRLYYLDDFSKREAHHVHHQSNTKEQEIWLWHCRLGHPSFSYLRHLFPDLFLHLKNVEFTCENCISDKSHRTSYHEFE